MKPNKRGAIDVNLNDVQKKIEFAVDATKELPPEIRQSAFEVVLRVVLEQDFRPGAAMKDKKNDEKPSPGKDRAKRGRGSIALAGSKVTDLLFPTGFLDKPKTNEEIASEISRKGWPIEARRVSDALRNLVRSGRVDRFGEPGAYKYVKHVAS